MTRGNSIDGCATAQPFCMSCSESFAKKWYELGRWSLSVLSGFTGMPSCRESASRLGRTPCHTMSSFGCSAQKRTSSSLDTTKKAFSRGMPTKCKKWLDARKANRFAGKFRSGARPDAKITGLSDKFFLSAVLLARAALVIWRCVTVIHQE